MATKFSTNYPLLGSANIFNCIWKFTRTMKAAGWIVKASSNGITKDTSGQDGYDLWGTNSDPTIDQYAVYYPYYTTVTAGSNGVNVNTFTGSGTLNVTSTAPNGSFPPQGALMVPTSGGNTIITYTGLGSAGTTFTGCNAVSSSGSATASGTLTTGNIVGTGAFTTVTVASNQASITAGTLNVASTSNFPIDGYVYVYTGTGMVSVQYTGLTGNSFTGCTTSGTGTVLTGYTVSQPALGMDTTAAWIVLSGPQTIRIPINANPTGSFLRGEIVTQSNTSATGELLGYVWDSVGSSGWACLLPQTGQFNCTNANTITGNSSGATMNPLLNGTMNTFNREVMIMKTNTQTQGTWYYICADSLDGYSGGPATTTVTLTSNNVNLNTFTGSGTLNVVSTTAFPSSGYILVQTLAGNVIVSYTGTSGGTSFTGCNAVSFPTANPGTVFTGTLVSVLTTVGSGSYGATISSLTTLSVVSTTGFPTQGTLLLSNTAGGLQQISYTNISGNTFTGCIGTGATGTLVSTTGSIVYPAGSESNQLFSVLATQSGCTPTVGPAAGGTNNAFPTRALVIRGTAGSTTGTAWFFNTSGFQQNAQMACVNTTPSTGVSADGSHYILIGWAGTTNTTDGIFGLQRLENTEPGDVDPYVYFTPQSQISWYNYAGNTTVSSSNSNFTSTHNTFLIGINTYSCTYGYCARGSYTQALDISAAFVLMTHYNQDTGQYDVLTCGGFDYPMRILNHPAAVKPLVFEPITVIYPNNGLVLNPGQWKGKLRWVFWTPAGTYLTTFANKTLLCWSQAVPTTYPGMAIGPWDGITNPLF